MDKIYIIIAKNGINICVHYFHEDLRIIHKGQYTPIRIHSQNGKLNHYISVTSLLKNPDFP